MSVSLVLTVVGDGVEKPPIELACVTPLAKIGPAGTAVFEVEVKNVSATPKNVTPNVVKQPSTYSGEIKITSSPIIMPLGPGETRYLTVVAEQLSTIPEGEATEIVVSV